MVLQLTSIVSAVWYSFLLYLGFYYLNLEQQLYEGFLDTFGMLPERSKEEHYEPTYFGLWVVSAASSTIRLYTFYTKSKDHAFLLVGYWMSLLFTAGAFLFFMVSEMLSMEDTKFWWLLGCLGQITIHGLIVLEQPLKQYPTSVAKYLFLLQALLYATLLASGYHYWKADLDSIIIISIISLIINKLTTLKNKGLLAVNIILMVWLLYSVIVYFDVIILVETKIWCFFNMGVLASLFALLFFQTGRPIRLAAPIREDEVLDDFSGLG
ncbi:MAG: hypothetical protein AB8E82_08815 [Aureispira sp.]